MFHHNLYRSSGLSAPEVPFDLSLPLPPEGKVGYIAIYFAKMLNPLFYLSTLGLKKFYEAAELGLGWGAVTAKTCWDRRRAQK